MARCAAVWLGLLLTLVQSVSAQGVLTSYATGPEAIFRTFLDAGSTTFQVEIFGEVHIHSGVFVYSPAFAPVQWDGPERPVFSVVSTQEARGNVNVWGNPTILVDQEWFFEFTEAGRDWWLLNYSPVDVDVYGCDLPASAYDLSGAWLPYLSGFFQICPEKGYDGSVVLEWRSAGEWLVTDYRLRQAVMYDPATVQVTPEPASLALLATGLVGLGAVGWRRKRQGVA